MWVNFSNLTSLEKIRVRLAKALSEDIQLNLSTEKSKELLRSHLNTKINLVTMFVDISHSTEMSLSLPERKFALLVQCFTQEVSIAAIDYGGYVFKYEGDALIVIFPAEHDEVKACVHSSKSINCSNLADVSLNPTKGNIYHVLTLTAGFACMNITKGYSGEELGAEHEVIDEELRASSEEIGEGRRALVGLKMVLFVDSNPRQLLPPLCQFVTTPRQLLLGLEQLKPGRKPLVTCSNLVVSHCFSPFCRQKSPSFLQS
jgi:hypothetical protein